MARPVASSFRRRVPHRIGRFSTCSHPNFDKLPTAPALPGKYKPLFSENKGLFLENNGLFWENNGLFLENKGHFSENKGLFRGDVAFSCFAFSITSKKVPTRKWKMAGGYLFNHESYYNGLTTDWSYPPLSRAHTRTRTRVLHLLLSHLSHIGISYWNSVWCVCCLACFDG